MKQYETELELFCKSKGWFLTKEVKIIPGRKHRVDYLVTMLREYDKKSIVIEVNGGVWGIKNKKTGKKTVSGHSSGTGILRDYFKSNVSQTLGYIYLQYTPQQMQHGLYMQHLDRIRNM